MQEKPLSDYTDVELNEKIKKLLYVSNLEFEQARSYFEGLQFLPTQYKVEFIELVEEDPEKLYSLYANFAKKLKELEADDRDWDVIVEDELNKLKE